MTSSTVRLLEEMQRHADFERQRDRREQLTVAAMILGEEGTLLGKPVRVSVEWLEGLPCGMDEDQLRRLGERMKAAALSEEPRSQT